MSKIWAMQFAFSKHSRAVMLSTIQGPLKSQFSNYITISHVRWTALMLFLCTNGWRSSWVAGSSSAVRSSGTLPSSSVTDRENLRKGAQEKTIILDCRLYALFSVNYELIHNYFIRNCICIQHPIYPRYAPADSPFSMEDDIRDLLYN